VLSGDVYVKSDGYSRIRKLSTFKEEGQEKYVNRYYQKNGITVKDFEFLNQDNDSLPAEQKFKFQYQPGSEWRIFCTSPVKHLFPGLRIILLPMLTVSATLILDIKEPSTFMHLLLYRLIMQ